MNFRGLKTSSTCNTSTSWTFLSTESRRLITSISFLEIFGHSTLPTMRSSTCKVGTIVLFFLRLFSHYQLGCLSLRRLGEVVLSPTLGFVKQQDCGTERNQSPGAAPFPGEPAPAWEWVLWAKDVQGSCSGPFWRTSPVREFGWGGHLRQRTGVFSTLFLLFVGYLCFDAEFCRL